jgi:NAD(P)-dependent dehydrogenase (short-subunit alcohol dehydrogenase family)
LRLKDRVVIVTGGAQGIGRTYVLRLVQEGAKVVVADVGDTGPVVDEVRRAGGEAIGLSTDVTNETATQAMAQKTLEAYGRIDVLVNNAGIAGRFARVPVEEISVELWDQVLAVNAKGMFLCAKAVLSAMKAQQSGRIINISSHTFYLGAPGMLAYTTSKGCVLAFTRALAREVGDYGIAVNALAPDFIPMDEDLREVSEYVERSIQSRCFKRSLAPEDLVGTLVYLASDDSAFVTGQTLLVNGGSYLQ